MFQEWNEIETLDLSSFKTENVINMDSLFCGCKKLKIIKGLENFITKNSTYMASYFFNCNKLEILDMSNLIL